MKKVVLLFFIFSICSGAKAQGTFHKFVGGSAYDEAFSIIQSNDGGYALCGYTVSYGAGSSDVYIVKLDASGNIEWTKTIGGSGDDRGMSIVQANDGGYAIGGYTNSFGAGGADVFVVKLDGSGNLQWKKTIGGTNGDHGYDIVQTSDGGYAIGGSTFSFGAGGSEVYAVKLDSTGSLQWTKTIGSSGGESARAIIQTNDGGYALAGYTSSFGAGMTDFYFVKLDASGNLQATRTLGGSNTDEAWDIIQTLDGGYALAGRTDSTLVDDMYVVKLSSTFNAQWQAVIGENFYDGGVSIVQDNDGSYIVCGYSDSFGGPTAMDFYLVKLSSNGNLSWTRSSGSVYNETGYSVIKTSDGGYAACGSVYNYAFDLDWYVVKMDANGNTCDNNGTVGTVTNYGTQSSGGSASLGGVIASVFPDTGSGGVDTMLCSSIPTMVESKFNKNTINISPNPATSELTIINHQSTIINVEIFNALGEKVYDKAEGFRSNVETINVSKLSSGIYFVRIKTKSGMSISKFVKE